MAKKPKKPLSSRGPKTPEARARSLANLKPYPPGVSGNPAGRKTCGAYVAEYLNSMATMSEVEIAKILKNDATPMAQRIAAARMLAAMIDGDDFDRVCDRTEGKPSQSVSLNAPAMPAAVAILTPLTSPKAS